MDLSSGTMRMDLLAWNVFVHQRRHWRPNKGRSRKSARGYRTYLRLLEKLVNDILTTYPAGQLPPIDKVTQRKREDIEAVIKGPANGGRHIYTLTY